MRPSALAAMSGRPARHFVDAAAIRAADLAWDRAASRGDGRARPAGGRRGPGTRRSKAGAGSGGQAGPRRPGPAVARPSAVTTPDTADKYRQLLRQLVRVHEAFRYDAFQPSTDPDSWWYRCDVCGDKLTGAELKASPVIHVVRSYERIGTGRYVEVYRRYGTTTA